MKKITDLWEKECICCTTQEECDIIMDMMHDSGLKWRTGKSYKETRISNCIPYHCYRPHEWSFWSKNYYESEWYTICPASDFIEAKRQPKQGERVLVRDYDDEEWKEGIFLCEVPQAIYPYICVARYYESDYIEWKKISFNRWKQIKQLPTTSTYTIECTNEEYKKVQDILNSK